MWQIQLEHDLGWWGGLREWRYSIRVDNAMAGSDLDFWRDLVRMGQLQVRMEGVKDNCRTGASTVGTFPDHPYID